MFDAAEKTSDRCDKARLCLDDFEDRINAIDAFRILLTYSLHESGGFNPDIVSGLDRLMRDQTDYLSDLLDAARREGAK